MRKPDKMTDGDNYVKNVTEAQELKYILSLRVVS